MINELKIRRYSGQGLNSHQSETLEDSDHDCHMDGDSYVLVIAAFPERFASDQFGSHYTPRNSSYKRSSDAL